MTLLALQKTRPVKKIPPHVQRNDIQTFTEIFLFKFPSDMTLINVRARDLEEERMELLYHVYWIKIELSCIYLNADPVCDR